MESQIRTLDGFAARLRRRWGFGWVLAILLVVAACGSSDPGYRVVLGGLNEPRGLAMRTDGSLCVAEAGRLAEGQTAQEGSTANRADTGSASCVSTGEIQERIVERLPYVFYNGTGVTTGPADVAELDGELYLITGEGQGPLARKLLRVSDVTAPPEVVADLLSFSSRTEPDILPRIDFSNPFAMIPDSSGESFLVTDGATGLVLKVSLDGAVQMYSEVEGHEVLTGIVRGPDDLVYVSSFSELPHAEGDGAVVRINPDGSSAVAADNLTTPIDLAFDSSGFLYVLEFTETTDADDPYRGTTGRLIRLDSEGQGWVLGQVLVQGLPFPTALLIDNEDRIYISVRGAFSSPSSGLVLRFDDLAWRAASEPPIQYTDDLP